MLVDEILIGWVSLRLVFDDSLKRISEVIILWVVESAGSKEPFELRNQFGIRLRPLNAIELEGVRLEYLFLKDAANNARFGYKN